MFADQSDHGRKPVCILSQVQNIHNEPVDSDIPVYETWFVHFDFKYAEEGVKFGTTGHTRSPEEYFINMIQSIRQINGTCLPVSVFTDGRKNELQQLFQLDNIHLIEGNNDLTDMLLLSKADVIISSAGSTFSSWAGFISKAILIVQPEYESLKIRSKINNETLYEGRLDNTNEQLMNKIKLISV